MALQKDVQPRTSQYWEYDKDYHALIHPALHAILSRDVADT